MIILSILKIIAVVVLILLILVLLITALLLFAPFRYKVDLSFMDESLDGTASIGWLLSIIKLNAEYHKGKEPEAYVLLFGKKIYDIMEGSIDSKGKKKKQGNTFDAAKSNTDYGKKSSFKEEKSSIALQKSIVEKHDEKSVISDNPKLEIISRGTVNQKPERISRGTVYSKKRQRPFILRVAAKIKNLCRSIYENIKNTLSELFEIIKAVCSAIKDKSDKLKALYILYHEEKYSGAVALLKHCIANIYAELKPVKGNGHLIYGSGDPYSTGTAMELVAVLYPAYCSFLKIIPDFEKAELEARLGIKGRIRLFFVGIPALRIYINKDLKAMHIKIRKILELDRNEDLT